MPTSEIKALREAGRLEEAMEMARTEYQADPENIWTRRNIAWVHYAYLKQAAEVVDIDLFLDHIRGIKELNMPSDEDVLYGTMTWQIGKLLFTLGRNDPEDHARPWRVWEAIAGLPFPRPSEGFSYLYKALHKAFKESDRYTGIIDSLGLDSLRPEDHEPEKMPNGKDVMALSEQVHIAYARHLLPRVLQGGEVDFDKEKALAFIPRLESLGDRYPRYTYPSYFQAKLMLAAGDRAHVLSSLVPFVRRKKNDFWAWDVLAEAMADDPDKVLACYCRGLLCQAPEEMLVSLRQHLAALLVARQLYPEARTEIDKLVKAREARGWRIPSNVENWKAQGWYASAEVRRDNESFYRQHAGEAEGLLYADVPEEKVFVYLVNKDKKIASFIATPARHGFFKYDRFLDEVRVGDVLRVRVKEGTAGEAFKLHTVARAEDDAFRKQFVRKVQGEIKIYPGNSFGLLGDVFIHPSLVARLKLRDGMPWTGTAVKSYNPKRSQWGWSLMD